MSNNVELHDVSFGMKVARSAWMY